MSAYICDMNHVLYLVAAAMRPALNRHGSSFSYYWNGERRAIAIGDYERGAEVANMLWLENARSVGARYPSGSSANLPGPVGGIRRITPADLWNPGEFDAAQVFKAIDCYSYQSCETNDWTESEAFAFCAALRKGTCSALPGYEAAEWGAPERAPARKR